MYSYDRRVEAANRLPKTAEQLDKKVIKAMQTYGKAEGTLEDVRKVIEELQPSFNSMSGNMPVEVALNELYRELRVITQKAKDVSHALRLLRDPKVKKTVEAIKAHPMAQ